MRIPWWPAETRSDFRALALEAAPVLLVFVLLSKMVRRGINLPSEVFEGSTILGRAVLDPGYLVLVLLPPLLLLPFWQRLRWSQIEGAEHGVRFFIGILCVASAFTFATYDYNLFLDQAHLGDRLLILLVAAAAFIHPVFAVLYGAVGMLVVQQFEFPVGLFTWLDKRILFVVLHLFTAFLGIGVIRRQRAIIFVGLASSILAANYVFPGFAKIRTTWLFQDNLANLAIMTHLNGWFGQVETERFVSIVRSLQWLNLPLLWGTLVVELGALFLFANRRYFAFIVIGTVALHGGIFLSSGICFWKWVLFNLGVWWMVMRAPNSSVLFSRGFLAISIVTILTAPQHARPNWLAWYDAPADEFTEFEVEGVSGKTYRVERGFFEPHDVVFAQNRFYFMNEQPSTMGTFGATTNAQLDRELTAATSPAEVDSLIDAYAVERFDRERKQQFEHYLKLFFATLNERGSKELWISRLRAPHHIWNQRPEPVYRVQEPVREVRAVYHRVYFDGEQVHELETRTLTTIDIPMTRAEVGMTDPEPGATPGN